MRYQAAAVSSTVAAQLVDGGDESTITALLDTGIDLDKMWHAAQIVIAGSLEPPEPLLSGRPVGPDLGFGPAVLAGPDDVARVAGSVAGLSRRDLIERFDPNEMAAQMVYPMIWDEDPADLAEEVADAAEELIDLYRNAAHAGDAILAAVV